MIQNGTKKLTAFETVLAVLLDNGHTVIFKGYNNGQISVKISSDQIAVYDQISVSASSLEQVGDIFINAAVAGQIKANPDQGGAGDTRIDGGETREK